MASWWTILVCLAFSSPEDWQQLEVVPVQIRRNQPMHGARPGQLPKYIRFPSGRTILCQGEASPACQKILEKTMSGTPDDEDFAYGDGYYSMNWPDMDEDADVGIINMPYEFDYDLLGAHKIAISGVEPCGGCAGESS